VPAGGLLRYDAVVNTTGPDDLIGAALTVTLPLSTSVQAVSTGCSHSGGVVTCLLGTLAFTATAAAQIWGQVAPDITGTVTATAVLRAVNFDPVPANNVVTVTTGIRAFSVCCRQYLPSAVWSAP